MSDNILKHNSIRSGRFFRIHRMCSQKHFEDRIDRNDFVTRMYAVDDKMFKEIWEHHKTLLKGNKYED